MKKIDRKEQDRLLAALNKSLLIKEIRLAGHYGETITIRNFMRDPMNWHIENSIWGIAEMYLEVRLSGQTTDQHSKNEPTNFTLQNVISFKIYAETVRVELLAALRKNETIPQITCRIGNQAPYFVENFRVSPTEEWLVNEVKDTYTYQTINGWCDEYYTEPDGRKITIKRNEPLRLRLIMVVDAKFKYPRPSS